MFLETNMVPYSRLALWGIPMRRKLLYGATLNCYFDLVVCRMLEISDISDMITTDPTVLLYLSCISTVLLSYVVLFASKCWARKLKYAEMPTD